MEDGNLDPVIVSSFIYVDNETSVRCLQSIIETVSNMSHNSGVWYIPIYIFACLYIYNLTNIVFVSFATLQLDKLKYCLTRCRDITKREFPSRPDLLDMTPKPDSINIDKLVEGGTITTDTCNAAHKVCRLLVEHINGHVNKQYCMHHLRNVWINGVAKYINKSITEFLNKSIYDIPSYFILSLDMYHVIRAFHK